MGGEGRGGEEREGRGGRRWEGGGREGGDDKNGKAVRERGKYKGVKRQCKQGEGRGGQGEGEGERGAKREREYHKVLTNIHSHIGPTT